MYEDDERALDAGEFSGWMEDIRSALRGGGEARVPCEGCTACCRSSQFVHIAPEETDTLTHIPRELLFPAPRAPKGHVLMGYDERGCCPMLIDDKCSIYEYRPRTCRVYDCRVFAAADVEVDPDKPLISERSSRWVFRYAGPPARIQHEAVRAAARFVAHNEVLSELVSSRNSTQLAVVATEIFDLFLREDGSGGVSIGDPDPAVVAVELRRRRADPL